MLRFKPRVATIMIIALISIVTAMQLAVAKDGDMRIIKRAQYSFGNADCQSSQTCDLSGVDYLSEDYLIEVHDKNHYGTRFYARYRTESIDNLEKYVFVNFIKGCVYESIPNNKDPKMLVNYVKEQYGDWEPFRYEQWTIDSLDTDPSYFSVPGLPRHFFYRWNSVPGSFSQETEKIYGLEKPDRPELYIIDHPGTAFFSNNRAKNISLKFKTCLFRAEDVPHEVNASINNFAQPVNCYYWESSFVYNHEAEKYEYPIEISSACYGN